MSKVEFHDEWFGESSDKGVTRTTASIHCFPLECYFAMQRVINNAKLKVEEQFDKGPFGPMLATKYPELTFKDQTWSGVSGKFGIKNNPWGIVSIRTHDRRLSCILEVHASNKDKVMDFVNLIKSDMERNSVLRGKSFSVSEEYGIELFTPEIEKPIFSDGLNRTLNYSIYSPIKFNKEVSNFRRGVLLAGSYGTGKSSVATYTAKMTTEAGLTFVYLKNARYFEQCVQAFSALGKTVLFVEDIDRLFENGRDSAVDGILNSLDGVDSKDEQTMYIFTTNNLEVIERALLRPGRVDSIVNMELPNLEATIAILNRYLRPMENAAEHITALVARMDANAERFAPAVLREICTRAMLAAKEEGRNYLFDGDLEAALESIRFQVNIINTLPPREENPFDKAISNALTKHYENE